MKSIFRAIKRMWLLFAQMLGKVNTILLLSLVYFVVIGFMALVMRLFRKDLLQKKMVIKRRTGKPEKQVNRLSTATSFNFNLAYYEYSWNILFLP
jgi:hypothetical protein